MRKALLPVLSLLLAMLSATARAQPPNPRPGAAAPAVSSQPSPALPSPSPISVPPPPSVSDPMLGPVPTPKRVLASWQEAVTYLHARSTDLKIALAEVLQAEAQTSIALAQYLPWINANNAGGAGFSHQLITRAVAG